MRAAVVLTLFIVPFAGCLDPDGAGAPDAALDASPGAPDPVLVAPTEFRAAFSGHLVYRTPGDRAWEGDDPGQCFRVPGNATRIVGVLDWEPPEMQMGLEFRHLVEGGQHDTSWDESGDLYVPPPITVVSEDPSPGQWFFYAGPGVAGGGVDWSLDFTLEGAPVDHDLRAEGC